MYEPYGLFIEGRWREAADAATLPVVDPATEEEVGVIPVATPSDLDDALRAAESGFRSWRSASVNVASALKVGNGMEPGVEMGPLANRRRLEAAIAFVEDARAGGAKVLTGGGVPAGTTKGYFFAPTVLSDLADDARMLFEEPFVPVAPLLVFDDFDQVIERANALPFGLAAYLFTNRLRTAERASDALEAGMVGVNDFTLAASEAPFGGIKESGIGREGGTLGIREYLEPKTVKTVS